MKYLNFNSQYDKYPSTKVDGKAYRGYSEIVTYLSNELKGKNVVAFEMYPGVSKQEIVNNLIMKLGFDRVIDIETCALSEDDLDKLLKRNMTDDRVFGLMSHFEIEEFYDLSKLEEAKKSISSNERVAIYGFGASMIHNDSLIYLDMTRWEIQLRYRKGMSNWNKTNPNEDNLRKYKRGYFIEWRTADRLKKRVLRNSTYYIDSTVENDPKLILTDDLFKGIRKLSTHPFRLVPYFDPGVWGGQWMKEVCNLDPSKKNYAWSFDGVPEENCVLYDFNGIKVASPAINIVFFEPVNLLGNKVHARFGTEFPIRFDFLDTFEGGNLSLQVHPLTEYIQDKFGMHYTQDESYYILDAKEDSVVYLGVKEGINKDDLINDLKESQRTGQKFNDEKYINKKDVVDLLENKLVLITGKQTTTEVKDFVNIAKAETIAIGNPEVVPAGQYAKMALTHLGLYDALSSKYSLGGNVTEVLNWVASSSSEVGIVYSTDAKSSKDVKVLATCENSLLDEPIIYPVAKLAKTKHSDETEKFIKFIQKKSSLKQFENYGFTVNK